MGQGIRRLGQRLRQARLARDMTQGELAKGRFSVSYVSAVERGQIRPSLSALTTLAETLRISVTDLLSDGQPAEREHDAVLRSRSDEHSTFRPGEEPLLDILLEAERRIVGVHLEDLQAAVQSLSQASGRALQPYEAAHVRWLGAEAAWRSGDLLATRLAAYEALSYAEGALDALIIVKVRLLLARAFSAAGDGALALSHARIGLHVLEESDMRDPMLTVEALGLLGSILEQVGEQAEGERMLARAIAESEQGKVAPRALAEAYTRLSTRYVRRGTPLASRYYLMRSVAAYAQARVEVDMERVQRAVAASSMEVRS